MSLALIGDGASYEFRWRRWALLRDTVSLALEAGARGTKFPRIAMLDELAHGPRRVDARELATEVEQLRRALAAIPVAVLAISPATAAVLYLGAKFDGPRLLTSAERAQISPAGDANNLADYFESLLDGFDHVCRHPHADASIEVLDG